MQPASLGDATVRAPLRGFRPPCGRRRNLHIEFQRAVERVWERRTFIDALTVEYWVVVAVAVFAIVAMVTVAAWRAAGRHFGQIWGRPEPSAQWLIAAAMWLGLAFGGAWLWWVFNLVMLAGVLAMIVAGYRWNRAYLINLAVPIFAITLFPATSSSGLACSASRCFHRGLASSCWPAVRHGVPAPAPGATYAAGGV